MEISITQDNKQQIKVERNLNVSKLQYSQWKVLYYVFRDFEDRFLLAYLTITLRKQQNKRPVYLFAIGEFKLS